MARKIYKEIRNNIKNKDIKDNIIFNKVINDKNILSKETILIYIPINNEVDTIKIINYFLPTKNIAIPKVIGNDMKFCYIKDLTHLKKGPFNILESQTNNYVTDFHNTICIVPGICFDKNNNRIGYGKGYYDKF